MNFLIKVFKTNINEEKIANKVITNLDAILPHCNINFDLNDCDNILRIVAKCPTDIDKLINYVTTEGYSITLLD